MWSISAYQHKAGLHEIIETYKRKTDPGYMSQFSFCTLWFKISSKYLYLSDNQPPKVGVRRLELPAPTSRT
jgi:hypothetical protein